MHEAGRLAEAEIFYRQALAVQPNNADALNLLGIIAHQMASEERGKLDEAIALYRRAIRIKPTYGEAHANLGVALQQQGKLEDAREAFEKAIEVAPTRAATYRFLSSVKQFSATDPHIASMESMMRGITSLSPDDEIDLHFALGKAYGDLGNYTKSFYHLLEGNALKRRRIVYDEQTMLAMFDRIRAVFTPQQMRDKEGCGYASSVPVFIVGMPRSGTTLVEQILASHPKVFGAGELNEFGKAVDRLSGTNAARSYFPELISSIPNEQLGGIGASYINAITAIAPAAERIVDKLPMNFLFTGLIYLALPNARIIHMRRSSVDTCLSCFGRLFTDRHLYSYDLGELGRYYRAYEMLMEHWRRILPPGFMLEVRYEDVVSNLEGEARRIVDHCGLEWDTNCLSFYNSERPVRTASAAQVRRPIYRSSVGRWRAYEHLLGPLIEALAGAEAGPTVERPTGKGDSVVADLARGDAGGSSRSPRHLFRTGVPNIGERGLPANSILVDAVSSVASLNGLVRIDCLGTAQGEQPSGVLLIPADRARQVLRSLVQAVQELQYKLRQQA